MPSNMLALIRNPTSMPVPRDSKLQLMPTPVVIVTAVYGERGTSQLLVFSQVVLSMQLPFAVIPLVRFVSDRRKMGDFAISRSVAAVAWIVAAIIVALNVKLLFETFFG